MLQEYLSQLKAAAAANQHIVAYEVIRERTSVQDAYIRMLITFSDGSRMEAVEFIRLTPEQGPVVERYSFHWMDSENRLIVRWDNAPHYADLPGYPDHVHRGNESEAVPGEPMNFHKVLDAIGLELR